MPLDSVTLKVLNYDWDAREVWIREIVRERLAIHPPPRPDDAIVASYFLVLRTMRLETRGGGDRLPSHQRHQTPAGRLALGSLYGKGEKGTF